VGGRGGGAEGVDRPARIAGLLRGALVQSSRPCALSAWRNRAWSRMGVCSLEGAVGFFQRPFRFSLAIARSS